MKKSLLKNLFSAKDYFLQHRIQPISVSRKRNNAIPWMTEVTIILTWVLALRKRSRNLREC